MNNSALTRLKKHLAEKDLSACLITSSANIGYLTGFYGFSPFEREAYLLVTKTEQFLLTDARYTGATEQLKDFVTLELTREMRIVDHLNQLLANHNLIKIGFEDTDITVAEFVLLKELPIRFSPLRLRDLRIVKNKVELEAIKKANTIAMTTLSRIYKCLQEGMTEKEVAKQFELEVIRHSAHLSFSTIVAFGANAAIPHHVTGTTQLKKNDVILVDFGVNVDNYCSDTTRTFFVGEVSEKWQTAYDVTFQAQKIAVDYISTQLKKGEVIKAKEVDSVARSYIISKGYPSIPHSLGHGIGLEVHEAPSLSPTSTDLLTDGMVFSIEPGIYLPGEMGIRIEDLFTISQKKLIKLTPS